MSQKKNYSRYFIILQEDEKGYGVAADKSPTGYAKLEIKNGKCRISFYVQNLKKEMKPYHMILIFNKNNNDKKLIKLGELNIDDTGRSEVSREYEAGNIADTSMQVDKISGAAVTRFVDTNMICVMSGFTSTRNSNDWKQYELVDVSKESGKTKFDEYEEKIEKSKEEAKYIKQEEIQELKEDRENEQLKQEEPKEKVKTAVNENEENNERNAEEVKKDEDINAAETKDEITKEIEIKEEKTDSIGETVNQRADTAENESYTEFNLSGTKAKPKKSRSEEFFTNIAEDLKEWDDEFEELADCKWFRVEVASMDDMYRAKTYNKFTVLYYPMTNYYPYIIRHGHYMVGYKYDKPGRVKYLVYAIPGTKAHYDQPFGGRYGFVSWAQPKRNKGKYGNMGYWLMFYDFRKSVVVIPADR